jgi:ABC-type nitrate/sulfonate/bicarbonate transport system substrate-binding protein
VPKGSGQIAVFNQYVSMGAIGSAREAHSADRGTDLSKFRGDTWCQITAIGTTNSLLQLMAAKAGASQSDLNVVTLGSTAATLPALQSGRCDVVTSDLNGAAAGVSNEVSYVVENGNDPCVSIPLQGESIGQPLTTSIDFTKQYPEFTTALIAATIQGLRLVQANLDDPSKLYEMVPPEMKQALNESQFAATVELGKRGFEADFVNGAFTDQEIADTILGAKGSKILPDTLELDPTQLATNKFVQDAYTAMGIVPEGKAQSVAPLAAKMVQPTDEAAAAYKTLTGVSPGQSSGPSPLTSYCASQK